MTKEVDESINGSALRWFGNIERIMIEMIAKTGYGGLFVGSRLVE